MKHYCRLILYLKTEDSVYCPIATDMFQKICISCLPLPEKNGEAFYLATTTNITHYHIPLLKDSFISFMRSLTRFFLSLIVHSSIQLNRKSQQIAISTNLILASEKKITSFTLTSILMHICSAYDVMSWELFWPHTLNHAFA